MADKEIKISPCPFCGAKAVSYHAFPQFEEGWAIDCEHEDDCILRQAHGMFACEATEEKMAASWNRRAGEDALNADLKKQIHRATNAEYMGAAYYNMLEPTGLEVAKMWKVKGVTRVHFDWGPSSADLSGEGRAKFILDMEKMRMTHVGNVDGVPAESGT